MNELLWVEKYRPKSLYNIENHQNIVLRFTSFIKKREMPHLLLVGPPGVGKISSCLAFTQDLYGSHYANNVWEMNVITERRLSTPTKKDEVNKLINKIKTFASTAPLTGTVPFKIIILDDADNLTIEIQQAFRRIMEMYSTTCRFVLICTNLEKIIDPIQSRCSRMEYSPLDEKSVKNIFNRITTIEKIKIVDEAFNVIYSASTGNISRAITLLQTAVAIAGENTIDDAVIYQILSRQSPTKIRRMLQLSLSGNVMEAREILRSLLIDDDLAAENILKLTSDEIMRMYDLTDKWKIKLLELISDVDYDLTQTNRPEIHLFTLLAKLATIKTTKNSELVSI